MRRWPCTAWVRWRRPNERLEILPWNFCHGTQQFLHRYPGANLSLDEHHKAVDVFSAACNVPDPQNSHQELAPLNVDDFIPTSPKAM
jgi:hypothetical protein